MTTPRIEILEYQPRWQEEFRGISSRLREGLGDAASRIDHIGSTSVPGLAAKDVIDVQITVADLEHPRLQPALEGLGLTWRENITGDHLPPGMSLPASELEKRYARASAPQRVAHVHIRVEGRFNQRYALLCRDYLRSHAGTRDAYAEVKRQLARYFPNDVDAYYDIKDPAFDLFMSGAWEWAEFTNWQVGASDA
ncbi:MAG: GrpB family protein [Pleurocapsa sp. SU_196_0]|nr:GrpB family protein [Pleurocapsa sp. SU_196_0]